MKMVLVEMVREQQLRIRSIEYRRNNRSFIGEKEDLRSERIRKNRVGEGGKGRHSIHDHSNVD